MMSEKEMIHASKFLSLVLRHKPETIGIILNENGWTDVDILLQKSARHGMKLSKEALHHIVATNSKKRFVLNQNADKIRASQGHSVEVELGYSNQKPPAILYHGTGINSVSSILKSGLEKRNRQHVHLSRDIETAIKVGQRHGKPVVFTILAEQMFRAGFEFYLSDNGVWLTNHIPVAYLKQDGAADSKI